MRLFERRLRVISQTILAGKKEGETVIRTENIKFAINLLRSTGIRVCIMYTFVRLSIFLIHLLFYVYSLGRMMTVILFYDLYDL